VVGSLTANVPVGDQGPGANGPCLHSSIRIQLQGFKVEDGMIGMLKTRKLQFLPLVAASSRSHRHAERARTSSRKLHLQHKTSTMGGVPSKPDPSRTLEVVGCGYARTGTMSLQLALEKLLDGPVQHGGTHFIQRTDGEHLLGEEGKKDEACPGTSEYA
jgi:hypothetical protein